MLEDKWRETAAIAGKKGSTGCQVVQTNAKTAAVVGLTLRERKKAEKRDRIMAAASDLFAEFGYESVTTAQIAERADVGTGTLFRYAGSKAELLVAVMNAKFEEGVALSLNETSETGDVTEAILGMLHPLARESMEHPENMIAYEREALFGSPERQNAAASQVAKTEEAILRILSSRKAMPRHPDLTLSDLAHTIYATIFVDIVKMGAGHSDVRYLPVTIRRAVTLLTKALIQERN